MTTCGAAGVGSVTTMCSKILSGQVSRRVGGRFAGRQTLAAADYLPDDLREALAKISADHAD